LMDSLAELFEANDLLAGAGRGDQGGQGQLVESARIAATISEEFLDHEGLEEFSPGAGQLEVMLQVELGFLLRESLDVVAHQDPLLERRHAGKCYQIAELRASGDQQGERWLGVELAVHQEPELLEAILLD